MTLICNVGGSDLAALGYLDVTQVKLEGSAATGGYGTATLVQSAAFGGTFTPVDHQPVQLYEVDGSGHITYRWFVGFVGASEEVPTGSDEQTVIHCRDANELLDALQTKDDAVIGTNGGDEVDARVRQMVTRIQGAGATRNIGTTLVADLTVGVPYPHRSWQFSSLRQIMQDICTDIVDPLVGNHPEIHPAFYISPGTNATEGNTSFGDPNMNLIDLAATPTPSFRYSTRAADLAGAYKPILGPFKRTLDGTQLGDEQVQYNDTTPSNGTGATFTVNMSGTAVASVHVDTGGTGYPSRLIGVFTGGNGSGATADITVVAGVITLVNVTNGGFYTGVPSFGVWPRAMVWARVENTTAKTTYPNPWSNTNAWPLPIKKNSQAASDADCTTAATLEVATRAFSRETLVFSTWERVLPGQYVSVTNDDYGLVNALYPVASVKVDFSNPYQLKTELTLGNRMLELGETGKGALAPPVEGVVRVQAPTAFAVTNVYNYTTGQADCTFTWTASPTPPPVAGYLVYVRRNGVLTWYERGPAVLTLLLHFNASDVIVAYVVAEDGHGGQSPASNTLSFTAASATPPTAPGSLAQTNVFNPWTGQTVVTYTWTASTPGPGCTIDHYEIDVLTPNPGGSHYRHQTSVLFIDDYMNPGDTAQTVVRAYDNHFQVSPDSSPISFTAANFFAPDAPSAIYVAASGVRPDGRAWASIAWTAPGTTHGPHDAYDLKYVTNGVEAHQGAPGNVLGIALLDLAVNVWYDLSIRTESYPQYWGPYSTPPLHFKVSQPLGPPMGVAPSGYSEPERPLSGWTPDPGITLDPTVAYKTSGAWKFALESTVVDGGSTVVDGANSVLDTTSLRLISDLLPCVAADTLLWKLAYQRDSGGSITLTLYADWYSAADGTGFLSTTTTTPTAPTTSWQTKEFQMTVPASAKSVIVRVVAAVSAGVVAALWVASYQPPVPATSAANYGPGSIADAAIATGGITDSTKVQIKTSSSGGIDILDSGGTLRGRIYVDSAPAIRYHSIITGGTNIGVTLDDTYGDQLQFGTGGAVGVSLTAGAGGNATLLSGGGAGWQANNGGDNVITGGMLYQGRAVNTTQTIVVSDHTLWATGGVGGITLTAPAAATADREYTLYKVDAGVGAITVAAGAGDTIVGAATYILSSRYNSVTLESDGSHTWFVKASH